MDLATTGADPVTRPAHVLGDRALPRWTHPGAWWVWALGLATAASRTTNPLLLALIVAVAGWVVSRRRPDAPWARSYAVFLRLGLIVIAIRVAFTVVLGAGDRRRTCSSRCPRSRCRTGWPA